MVTAKEQWDAAIAAKMESEKCSRANATVLVAKENPELRQQLIEEANAWRRPRR